MHSLYYTYLEKGQYRRYRGDLFLVVYSKSKKRLIKYLDKKFEEEYWGDWRWQGSIVKDEKPTWYKYKNILGA